MKISKTLKRKIINYIEYNYKCYGRNGGGRIAQNVGYLIELTTLRKYNLFLVKDIYLDRNFINSNNELLEQHATFHTRYSNKFKSKQNCCPTFYSLIMRKHKYCKILGDANKYPNNHYIRTTLLMGLPKNKNFIIDIYGNIYFQVYKIIIHN